MKRLHSYRRSRTGAALVIVGLMLAGGSTRADELERVPAVTHAATRAECGECHLAFQPGLLPAGSWTRIMDSLADHFGEDAGLPAEQAAEIRAYLTSRAGRTGDPAIARITEQRWFLHEHRRAMRPETLSRPDIKTISNCAACHRGAEQGWYEED